MRAAAAVLLVLAGLWILADPGPAPPRADFVFANGGEPRSLDPALASAAAEGRLARALFEGLVRLEGPEAAVAPAAAESFSASPTGDRWTFRLRANGRWSDGAPVVASQFRDAFLRLLDPATGSRAAAYLFDVAGAREHYRRLLDGAPSDPTSVGVEAPSPDVLILRTNGPAPTLLPALAAPALAPIRLDLVRADPARWTHAGRLVSNGPYRLAGRSVRDRVRLVRNPHYWDAASVGFATVDALALDAPTTALNLYLAGEIDWLADVTPALLPDVRAALPDHLHVAPLYGTYFFRVNTRKKPFGNAKVRRALDLAADKEAVTTALLAGGERPARSLVPPLRGEPLPFRRDVAAARALLAAGLAEEGLDALPPFELACASLPLHQAVCELLQRHWHEAFGARTTVARMEAQAFFQAVEKGDYVLARGSWLGDYPDPLTFLDVFTAADPNNQTGFADPRFDRIVREDLRREHDPERRRALTAEAIAILDEATPVLPIYHYSSVNLLRPTIKGFTPNPLDVHAPHRWRR
jgi:oligopeptide transport system substrate-binding protein